MNDNIGPQRTPATVGQIQAETKMVRRELEKQLKDENDARIDAIYKQVDAMLVAGKFDDVNALLASLDPSSMTIDDMLSYLTITLAAKSRLPARAEFYRRAKADVEIAGGLFDCVFHGLE